MSTYEEQRAAEQAARIAAYERAAATAPLIAAAMGATIEEVRRTDDPPGSFGFTPRWRLTIPHDGRPVEYVLRHGGWKKDGRWSIGTAAVMDGCRYVLPRDYGVSSVPDITASDEKTPEQIGKDFLRRYVVKAAPLYLELLDKATERSNADARRRDMAYAFAKAIGGSARGQRDDRPSVYLYGAGGFYLDVEDFNEGRGTVSVKLSGVPADKLAAFINSLRAVEGAA